MYNGKCRPRECRAAVPMGAVGRTRRPQTKRSIRRNILSFQGATRRRWRGGRSVVARTRARQPGAVGSSQTGGDSSGGRREFEIAARTRSDRLARDGTAQSPITSHDAVRWRAKTPSRYSYNVAMPYKHNSTLLNALK